MIPENGRVTPAANGSTSRNPIGDGEIDDAGRHSAMPTDPQPPERACARCGHARRTHVDPEGCQFTDYDERDVPVFLCRCTGFVRGLEVFDLADWEGGR